MNKKYLLLFAGMGALSLFSIFTFLGFFENGSIVIDQDKSISYIPLNITKANPTFVIQGERLWKTTDISDVKDDVVYTLRGTVLSIGHPIDWSAKVDVNTYVDPGGYDGITIIGFIPITISVDQVYKGDISEEEFVFYLASQKSNDQYILSEDVPHFEIGKKTLVHLFLAQNSEDEVFPDGRYHVKLSRYGAYDLVHVKENPLVGKNIANDGVEYMAFNSKNPNGVPLASIISEALP